MPLHRSTASCLLFYIKSVVTANILTEMLHHRLRLVFYFRNNRDMPGSQVGVGIAPYVEPGGRDFDYQGVFIPRCQMAKL